MLLALCLLHCRGEARNGKEALDKVCHYLPIFIFLEMATCNMREVDETEAAGLSVSVFILISLSLLVSAGARVHASRSVLIYVFVAGIVCQPVVLNALSSCSSLVTPFSLFTDHSFLADSLSRSGNSFQWSALSSAAPVIGGIEKVPRYH